MNIFLKKLTASPLRETPQSFDGNWTKVKKSTRKGKDPSKGAPPQRHAEIPGLPTSSKKSHTRKKASSLKASGAQKTAVTRPSQGGYPPNMDKGPLPHMPSPNAKQWLRVLPPGGKEAVRVEEPPARADAPVQHRQHPWGKTDATIVVDAADYRGFPRLGCDYDATTPLEAELWIDTTAALPGPVVPWADSIEAYAGAKGPATEKAPDDDDFPRLTHPSKGPQVSFHATKASSFPKKDNSRGHPLSLQWDVSPRAKAAEHASSTYAASAYPKHQKTNYFDETTAKVLRTRTFSLSPTEIPPFVIQLVKFLEDAVLANKKASAASGKRSGANSKDAKYFVHPGKRTAVVRTLHDIRYSTLEALKQEIRKFLNANSSIDPQPTQWPRLHALVGLSLPKQ